MKLSNGKSKPNQRTITRFLSELATGIGETLRCVVSVRTGPHTTLCTHAIEEKRTYNCYERTHNSTRANPVPDVVLGSAKDVDIRRAFYAFVDGDEKGAADRAGNYWFDIAMEVVTGVQHIFATTFTSI